MLELIFQGFLEWTYGLILECWEYFSSMLLTVMSMDFAYLQERMPVIRPIMQSMLAIGWALLIGNLVFQAVRSMMTGLGFEAEDPKLLFTRTFVFAFLLLASPQICTIVLNMTSRVITLLDMPDAVDIQLAGEATFGGMAASWLLVIICGIVVMLQSLKLILEMAERYFILAVLTITSPLAFGMGGSRSTSDIFSGWCRMYGSMCLLTVLNVMFVKMLLSVLSFYPSGLDVFPWMVLVLTVVKVAKKADAIITRIGLNPAMTGDSLGRFPGGLTYLVARSLANNITHGAGNSAKGGNARRSPGNPPSGPNSPRSDAPGGARTTGAANVHNTQASAAQQNSTVQAGSSQSSVSENTAGMAVNNSRVNAAGASVGDSRKTSVPLGTRRAPSHVRPATPAAPVGTRGTHLNNTSMAANRAAAVQNGTAGMGTAAASERSSHSATHTAQSDAGSTEQNGSGINTLRSSSPAPAGNRAASQQQAAPASARFSHRDAGNARPVNHADHGTAGTAQSSEQNHVSVGEAKVSNSVSTVTQSPARQQNPSSARYSGRDSASVQAPAKAPMSTNSPAQSSPGHGTAENGPSRASARPVGEPRQSRNKASPTPAAAAKTQQPSTAQQKSRQPRQAIGKTGAASPALRHGTAGTAPNAVRAADKRPTEDKSASRASSRGKEASAEKAPIEKPETIAKTEGGGIDDGRTTE